VEDTSGGMCIRVVLASPFTRLGGIAHRASDDSLDLAKRLDNGNSLGKRRINLAVGNSHLGTFRTG
jgi:hypothetical protein